MNQIKVKVSCDRYGFKRLVFKDGLKEILYIYFPNQFKTGFRISGRGWCCDPVNNLSDAKRTAESYLKSYYSIFGGCNITYNI